MRQPDGDPRLYRRQPFIGSAPTRDRHGRPIRSHCPRTAHYSLLTSSPFVFITLRIPFFASPLFSQPSALPPVSPPPRFRQHDSRSDAAKSPSMFSAAYALFGTTRFLKSFHISTLGTLAQKHPGSGQATRFPRVARHGPQPSRRTTPCSLLPAHYSPLTSSSEPALDF